MPLTCAAVAAISACLPSLRSLALDYAGSWPPAGEDAGEQSDQLAYTAAQLLAVVGRSRRHCVPTSFMPVLGGCIVEGVLPYVVMLLHEIELQRTVHG